MVLDSCGLVTLFVLGMGSASPGEGERILPSGDPTAIATPSSGTVIDAASPSSAPKPASSSPSPASADTAIQRPGDPETTLTSKLPAWGLRDLLPLAAVLGLIVLIALLLRRLGTATRGRSGGPLRILQRAYLSPKQSVTLVRVGRRVVLLGVTPERINTLSQIEDPEECAWLLSASGGKRDEVVEFERLMAEEASVYQRAPIEAAALHGAESVRLREARGSLRGVLDRLRSASCSASPDEEPTGTNR